MNDPDRSVARRALDAASLFLIVCGETLGGFVLPSLRIGPFGGLFVLGIALAIVRHVVWRRPHLPGLLRRWLTAPAGEDGGRIVALTIATRAAVFAAGLISVLAFGYELREGQPRFARNEALNLPARYDAGWYVGIAREGYEWREDLRGRQQPIAFWPAYPLATRIAGDIVTAPARLFNAPGFLENGYTRVLWGGMLVSLICVVAAACRVTGLTLVETGDRLRARWAAAFLLLWPFALFFTGAYTESMFLLAMVGAVFAWKQQRLGAAAAWGVLCGLTRPNGWTLALALLADLVLRRAPGTSVVARALVALAPLGGAAIYSTYIFTLTGHPLEWARAHEAWGVTPDPRAFIERVMTIADPAEIAMLACVLITAFAAFWFVARKQWLYAAIIGAYLIPALLTNTPSVGRMTAVLFPVALMLVQAVPPRLWPALAIVFGGAQLWLAARHFIWKTPY